jgi:predicted molibdopterin-dependent oxidoreductase YjgC
MTSTWPDAIAALAGASLALLLDTTLDDGDIAALNSVPNVILFASIADPRLEHVALVLPIATMAEEQGVYVNRDHRAQRYLPAKSAPGMARSAWWIAAQAWIRGADGRKAPGTAAEAFGALAPFAGLSYRDLGLAGRVIAAPVTGRVA